MFFAQNPLLIVFGWFVVWLFVFSIVVFFCFVCVGLSWFVLVFGVGWFFLFFVFLMLMILERFVF